MLHLKILFNHRGHKEHGEKSRVRLHSRRDWGRTKTEKSASGLCAWLWSWLFVCASTIAVQAQEIDMSGTIDFKPSGNSVTLSAETIRNYRSQESTSGDLTIELWATQVPYHGQAQLSESPLNGIRLAQAPLGTLAGNSSRSPINKSVVFTEPKAGYYNVVLVLGELNGSDYRILDWFNFTQIEAFGGLSPFMPPAASAPKTLIDEYIGTWEEIQSPTTNGTTSETAVTTVIEKLQDRGFISKAYTRKPGSPLIETQTSHYENGAAYATTTSNGTQIEDSLGEWGVGNRTITSNSFSSYTQTTSTTLAEDGQVTVSSLSTSEGSAGDGHAEKIMTLAAAPPPTPPANSPGTPASAPPDGSQSEPAKKGKGAKKSSASKSVKAGSKSHSAGSTKKSSSSSSKKSGGKKSKRK
jgi:hypothetical protein